MALYLRINRIYAQLPLLALMRYLPKYSSKVVDFDILDNFTTQLLQKKANKWELKAKTNCPLTAGHSLNQIHKLDIGNLKEEELEIVFQNAIDTSDNETIIDLIKQSINANKCPSLGIILHVLHICAQNGDKDTIVQIQELCRHHLPDALKVHSNFNHFIAESIWIKGDVNKSIKLFEEVYRENAYIRRRLRLMLKYLIADVISSNSEAAVFNIISFSERLLRDFKDIFPLSCIWQSCFLSEWYADQCTALELLEKHNGLLKSVVSKISFVVFVSLKSHRTEVVYRLLEILLKYKMKLQYSQVLESLLDYQFRCQDLKSCSEIIRWSVENQVELPREHHVKFINLLLNQKLQTPLAPLKPKYRKTEPPDLTF